MPIRSLHAGQPWQSNGHLECSSRSALWLLGRSTPQPALLPANLPPSSTFPSAGTRRPASGSALPAGLHMPGRAGCLSWAKMAGLQRSRSRQPSQRQQEQERRRRSQTFPTRSRSSSRRRRLRSRVGRRSSRLLGSPCRASARRRRRMSRASGRRSTRRRSSRHSKHVQIQPPRRLRSVVDGRLMGGCAWSAGAAAPTGPPGTATRRPRPGGSATPASTAFGTSRSGKGRRGE